eukprot:1092980_1
MFPRSGVTTISTTLLKISSSAEECSAIQLALHLFYVIDKVGVVGLGHTDGLHTFFLEIFIVDTSCLNGHLFEEILGLGLEVMGVIHAIVETRGAISWSIFDAVCDGAE